MSSLIQTNIEMHEACTGDWAFSEKGGKHLFQKRAHNFSVRNTSSKACWQYFRKWNPVRKIWALCFLRKRGENIYFRKDCIIFSVRNTSSIAFWQYFRKWNSIRKIWALWFLRFNSVTKNWGHCFLRWNSVRKINGKKTSVQSYNSWISFFCSGRNYLQ